MWNTSTCWRQWGGGIHITCQSELGRGERRRECTAFGQWVMPMHICRHIQQTQGSMEGMRQTWTSTNLKKYLQACEKGKGPLRHNYSERWSWNFRATIHFCPSKFLRWAITHFEICYRFRKSTTLFSGARCSENYDPVILYQWDSFHHMSSNTEF